jgi:iron complex outermembrane receptor protein
VAQINANKWAITSRGFNDQYSFKLLVMIDGRTVYSPIFSGVYWQREDVPLEDVDRIEVIRGAGAAMWGANAVNGVINIITKKAKETQGGLITLGGGNQQQAFSVRYGDKLGDDFTYRVYGKGFKRNNNITLAEQNAHDDWEGYQAGFKSEWQLSKADTLTTQGDIYRIRAGDIEKYPLPTAPFQLQNQDSPAHHRGGNLQTRWQHKYADDSEAVLQLYYIQHHNNRLFVTPHIDNDKTLDVDFQHRFHWLNQDIIWGLNYRYFSFNSNENFKITFNPTRQNLQLFTGFLQDDISLVKDKLNLTLGTRLEHNDFTGFEVQPNIRLLWTPDKKHSVWAAVSRAVHTPSLTDTGAQFRLTVPGLAAGSVIVSGNPNFKSESVLDYEIGYRAQLSPNFSFDFTTFYNKYHNTRLVRIAQPYFSPPGYLNIPAQYTNNAKGETMGIELVTQWQPISWLKMQATYSVLKENVVVLNPNQGRRSPHQRFNFKANLNLPFDIEIDPMVRYVDTDVSHNIPHYVAFDLRTAWHPTKNLEFSVVGQNLLDNAHLEYNDEAFEMPQTQIRRSIFGKMSVTF